MSKVELYQENEDGITELATCLCLCVVFYHGSCCVLVLQVFCASVQHDILQQRPEPTELFT